MTIPTLIALNLFLGLFVGLAVAGLVALAHRLPAVAPHHDELWGQGGNPWVASEPLPLAQLVAYEQDRELTLAA